MKCKQGQLAYYVGAAFPKHHGRVVLCVRFRLVLGMPAWVIDPPFPVEDCPNFDPGWVMDFALRPIRDFGDELRKETLTPREKVYEE